MSNEPVKFQPFQPGRPVRTLRCAAEKDCGRRFHYQPRPDQPDETLKEIDAEAMWCSTCGYMKLDPEGGIPLPLFEQALPLFDAQALDTGRGA